MRICMFTNTYLPHIGGVARSVAFFAEDLRQLDHQVLVVAPTFPESRHPADDKGRVLRLPAVQNFNGSDFSVRIPIPFIISKEIDDFKPDILHSHHPFLMGDTALRIARLIRRRGVKRPIVEIPTGVDVDFFSGGDGRRFRKTHRIPANAGVVGHLGRLAPEKNLVYLAEAVADYLSRHAQSRFLVVGRGPSKAEIRRVFAERGLERQLVMPGSQSGQALSDAYSAMDLFVFSSRSETQGMVLLEAMAAGKPVIALDASGVREVVDDGRNGRLLAENASTRMLAAAIEDFFKNSKTAGQWGRQALRTARRLSRAVCARRLEKLYRSVLEERSARPVVQTAEELIPWDSILVGIKVEWELLSQKANAAAVALRTHEFPDSG